MLSGRNIVMIFFYVGINIIFVPGQINAMTEILSHYRLNII